MLHSTQIHIVILLGAQSLLCTITLYTWTQTLVSFCKPGEMSLTLQDVAVMQCCLGWRTLALKCNKTRHACLLACLPALIGKHNDVLVLISRKYMTGTFTNGRVSWESAIFAKKA
jgi:hypothetical protein